MRDQDKTKEQLVSELIELRQRVASWETAEAERRRGKDTLATRHTFQQSIIDGVADPIMVIGIDYRVKLMNEAARKFSSPGAGPSEPLLCYRISHRRETPCSGIEHPCPLEQVRDSGQLVTLVHEHYQANGERRFVEIVASPLWEADGRIQGIIESMRDITERRLAEEALQEYAERFRALAVRLAEAEETERQRLARELHDRLGQNISALGINLSILQSQIRERVTGSILSRLNDSLTLVENTTELIRDIMANLRPPVLDDYGLVAALRWYGEQLASRVDISLIIEGEEPYPRLATRVETALFRIAQEALTNVVKHAEATQATVIVEDEGDTVRLAVTDDGIGFDQGGSTPCEGPRGWGLLTMTERAEAVGGSFRIESRRGHGTRVVVEVAR